MHARQLVQLAGELAVRAELLGSQVPMSSTAMTAYWTAAKCREESWHRALTAFLAHRDEQWDRAVEAPSWILSILEEILIAEPLARVWAALCDTSDRVSTDASAGSIAKSVLRSHLEVRHRVLTLMASGLGMRIEEAVSLNHVRLRYERWTDTLLALLGPRAARAQWAFHPRLVRKLAKSLREQRDASGNIAVSVLLATLSGACSLYPHEIAPHAELNRKIACSLIACFPPHVFDGTGRLVSSRQLALQFQVADVQARIRIAEPTPLRDPPEDPHVDPDDAYRFRSS